MTKKELMVKAHKMTKEIKAQYPTINYKFQLGLCLTYLQNEGENEMVELQGTEKQVKWASDIREVVLKGAKTLKVEREKAHESRGKKRTLRLLEESVEIINRVENEISSKWFIDNFAYILRIDFNNLSVFEQSREIDAEIKLATSVYETFEKIRA